MVPNGDFRPFLVNRDAVVQRPLRSNSGHSAPDPRHLQPILRTWTGFWPSYHPAHLRFKSSHPTSHSLKRRPSNVQETYKSG